MTTLEEVAREDSLSLMMQKGKERYGAGCDLFKRMLEMSGSDRTSPPISPQVRVHGHLVPLDSPQRRRRD
jgi:hypothetical protein